MPTSAPCTALILPPKEHPGTCRLFAHIGSVAAIPTHVRRLIELAGSSNATKAQTIAALQGDPAMVLRVFRRINSPHYRLRGEITDLSLAINLLGTAEVAMIALTVGVARLFAGSASSLHYTRDGLWRHSLVTAEIARLIAQSSGKVDERQAYAAGLLHDIGLLLVEQHLPRQFYEILKAQAAGAEIHEAEMNICQFSHSQLGAHACKKWDLPEPLIESIGHHHTPLAAPPSAKCLASVIAIADFYSDRTGTPSLGVPDVPPPPAELFSELGLTGDDLLPIVNNLKSLVQSDLTWACA